MAAFDFSEVDQLAADLGEASALIGPFVNSAVKYTSTNVKKSAAKKVGGSKSWGAAAQAINYDVTVFQGFGVSVIKADIGYDKERTAGALGNLREFGAPDSPSGPLGPHNDLAIALHENEADFVKGLELAERDATQAALDRSTVARTVGTFIRGGKLGDG